MPALREQVLRRKPVQEMAAETGADSGRSELNRTIGLWSLSAIGIGGRSGLVVRVPEEFQNAPSLIHRIWRDVKGSNQSHRAFAEGSLAVQYHKLGMFEHEQEVKIPKAGVAGSNPVGGTSRFCRSMVVFGSPHGQRGAQPPRMLLL
jgi:hypothetical protein